ncbi:MAG: excinuclease ABC subunit UvrA [Bacteroidales bacterium]|jgi:excinuclease UvrABC ATPase subunit|nr:excinuclease ABC subunit UvrA [Bacteroidales bacterium]MCI1785146.1 excinuclease ABC subunit UvrA [Bacteroidales bacterium]
MPDIIIKNAHANNLRNIDIVIPRHKIVVFSGVSGSGKSSLLFDTIYTEAQRQLIETFGSFARARLPKLSRPDVDEIKNLSTPIVIDQKKMGNNLRSTVGTATELASYIRLLYSRMGQPFLNLPSFAFSFNHPEGMCPYCKGLGKEIKIDLDLFLDKEKSLREGAIRHGMYRKDSYMLKELLKYGLFDNEKPLKNWNEKELDLLLYSKPVMLDKSRTGLSYNRYHEGIVSKLERSAREKAMDEKQEDNQDAWSRFLTYRTCPYCKGSRINERARSVKVNGIGIDEAFEMEIGDLSVFMRGVRDPAGISAPIIRRVTYMLEQLDKIGAGYLSLDRPVSTLSGGESQRVKMARQLDCDLVDLMYILDEPSIGLHPRDTEMLMNLLREIRNRGNSVFVVEHDPEIIQAAEWIVDMGPQAGSKGGEIVYSGPVAGLEKSGGLTGRYLRMRNKSQIQVRSRPWSDYYLVEHACVNNLKDISVRIPKGVLTCVTGVAGCGKSSLIHGCFVRNHPEACVIDQQPIGRTSRGNIASYIGIFSHIRQFFADSCGEDISLFSFNSEGACPKCEGRGYISYEMNFLDAIRNKCDECGGKRYNQHALNFQYKGKDISEVLDLTVSQAMDFFAVEKKVTRYLKLLMDVGLGYVKLGQTLSSLSGGENQRLKIATELRKKGNIYVMDEPTTGLHMSDINNLFKIVCKLVDTGNTVVIIEHNLDIIKKADWIIDLGPEGGKNGGEVLFEGTPEDLKKCTKSITARYLDA